MSKFKHSDLNRILGFDQPEAESSSPEENPHSSRKRRVMGNDEKKRKVERVQARHLNGGVFVSDACKAEGISEGEYNGWRKKFGYPTITELKKKAGLEELKPKDSITELLQDSKDGLKRSPVEQERDEAIQERDEMRRQRDDAIQERNVEVRSRNHSIGERIEVQKKYDQLQERYDRLCVTVKRVCGFLPDLVALDNLVKNGIPDDGRE